MAKVKSSTKKQLRILISETLINSLSNLKEGMNEKKFNRNIKKASKVLVADFKLAKVSTPNKQGEQTV